MPLVTVRDAATQLGVGYSTLKQWIYQGRVRTTQTPGGHHRIAESELERLLARRSQSPARRKKQSPRGVIVTLSGRNQLRGFVESDADRHHHAGRRHGTEATPRRRGAGDRQSDRGDGGARGRATASLTRGLMIGYAFLSMFLTHHDVHHHPAAGRRSCA